MTEFPRALPWPAASQGALAPLAALVAGAVAMGASPIFVRLAEVGPFTSALWRVALALPLLYAWVRLADDRNAPGERFSQAGILAGLAFAALLIFWHLSIVHTSVANATFFATTAPIWVVLFGWLLFRHTVTAGVIAGLALCLIGGAALLAQSFEMHPAGALGDAFGIATGVFYGFYILAVQAARKTASAARITFEAAFITAAILFIVALIAERSMLPHTVRGVASLIAVAWISHSGGQGLLSIALGRLPAAFSSLVIFLEAIAAATFGYLILGESVSRVQAFGGLAILVGIFIAYCAEFQLSSEIRRLLKEMRSFEMELLAGLGRRGRNERVDAYAGALIDEFGIAAYAEARRREDEASSQAIALAWSDIALAVARKAASLLGQDTSIRIAMDAVFAPQHNPPAAQTHLMPTPLDGSKRALPATMQLFRIEFVGAARNRGPTTSTEVVIQVEDVSAAIVVAANFVWPPRTTGLRILDAGGREVFGRGKSDLDRTWDACSSTRRPFATPSRSAAICMSPPSHRDRRVAGIRPRSVVLAP
jgi:drug/metabolite transporter (DMT)-like permease